MRVALLVPTLDDPAHRRVARELSAALRRRGHRVDLLDGGRGHSALERARGADVLHVHWFSRGLAWLGRSSLPARSRLVLTHQGAAPALLEHPRAFDALARRAAAVTAVSADGLERLLRFRPGLRARARLVYNGVDLGAPPGRLRSPRPFLLTVGRLAAYKGLDLALVAFAGLSRRIPGLELRLCGPDQSGGRLAAFAARLGLGRRVVFIGRASPARVRSLLARCLAFVQPSRSENMPLALLEAMAAGAPIVACEAGGIPEAVRHGRSALLVAPGDAAGLERALERICLEPGLGRRLGREARLRSERFSWDRIARDYERVYRAAVLCAAAAVLVPASALCQEGKLKAEGRALYLKHCASCHDRPGERVPHRRSLAQLPAGHIEGSLIDGVMRAVGAGLTPEERRGVSAYLSRVAKPAAPRPDAGRCRAAAPADPARGPGWSGWGNDPTNGRVQSAEAAGLSSETVGRLRLKWAVGFPETARSIAQPALGGGRLFVGSQPGAVVALDPATGCRYWSFQAERQVRSAVSVSGDRIVFGDLGATVYALDAASGTKLWATRVDEHPYAIITGAPVVHGGRVYVPVSSREEGQAADPRYECCRFRGSVAALDLADGRLLWKIHAIAEEPKPAGVSSAGTRRWGPSGAAIWSAPTVDASRGALYVVTGNDYTEPATAFSDALLALDLQTGKLLWSRQFTQRDVANGGCGSSLGDANCPRQPGADLDFGASPVLRELPGGRRVLLLLQKSGTAYGVDPDSRELLWSRSVSPSRGGDWVPWGAAADGRRAYVPAAYGGADSGRALEGGVAALDLATGEQAWMARVPGTAFAAAITLAGDVVLAGALDGRLFAFAAADGKRLWETSTARPFKTVNGLAGAGGSINAAGPVAAGGMLFVESGDVLVGRPGNVLLGFSVP